MWDTRVWFIDCHISPISRWTFRVLILTFHGLAADYRLRLSSNSSHLMTAVIFSLRLVILDWICSHNCWLNCVFLFIEMLSSNWKSFSKQYLLDVPLITKFPKGTVYFRKRLSLFQLLYISYSNNNFWSGSTKYSGSANCTLDLLGVSLTVILPSPSK